MFFNYSQNNSGGSFEQNEDLDTEVFIEADSLEEANRKANSIGIYFNGVAIGYDCDCCGDRWSEPYTDEGTDFPMLYDKPIYECKSGIFRKQCIIHYKNGSKEVYKFKD